MTDLAQLSEARLLLSWAAQALTETERAALNGLAAGEMQCDTGRAIGRSNSAVSMALQSAFPKMRRRLALMGVYRTEDVL